MSGNRPNAVPRLANPAQASEVASYTPRRALPARSWPGRRTRSLPSVVPAALAWPPSPSPSPLGLPRVQCTAAPPTPANQRKGGYAGAVPVYLYVFAATMIVTMHAPCGSTTGRNFY